IVGGGVAALLLCLTATRSAGYLALTIQGLASSLIGPGIAAISPAFVGQPALSRRVGRDARLASIGNGLAGGVVGIAGSYLPAVSVFLVAAVLALPALASLLFIKAERPMPVQPSTAEQVRQPGFRNVKSLLLDRRLVIFAICVVL